MLSEFFETLHEGEVKRASNRSFVETLKLLSNDELRKLASGETKLADDDSDWLQKYQGTPLFERAVALEQQKIELDAQDQEHRQAREELMDQLGDHSTAGERDRLLLEKRVLDLELATQGQAGAGAPEEALEAQEGAGLELAQKAHEAEQAKKGQPAKPQGGMTVSVKQDAPKEEATKPEEPREQDTAAKVAAVVELARSMARQDAKLASDYGPPEEVERQAQGEEAAAKKERAFPGVTRARNAVLGGIGGAGVGAGAGMLMGRHVGPLALGGGAVGALTGIMDKPGLLREENARSMRNAITPEALEKSIGQNQAIADHVDQNPGEVRTVRALLGGSLGAGLGAGFGAAAGRPGLGALVGGGAGALLGGVPKPSSEGIKEEIALDQGYLNKLRGKTAGLAGLGQKALGAVKPFAQTLGAGAKEVGQAFSSGGAKAGLGALKDVGSITAKAHPLGTAALAGGAGFAVGKSMSGRNS